VAAAAPASLLRSTAGMVSAAIHRGLPAQFTRRGGQLVRQTCLGMSMDQRKQAAEEASAWLHAHQGDVPVQHATLHDDG
jgi:hypothetical protein